MHPPYMFKLHLGHGWVIPQHLNWLDLCCDFFNFKADFTKRAMASYEKNTFGCNLFENTNILIWNI